MKARDAKPAAPRDITLWMWAVFIFFFPIYVAPSGLPQPADVLIVVLAPMTLRKWDGRLPIAPKRAVFWLLIFMVYVTVSNMLWSVFTGTFSTNLRYGFLLSPLFYIYNALVFLIAIVMYKRKGEAFLEMTVRAVLFTVIAQVPISLLFGHSTQLRSSGMFNAPNQLGYFAVLSASIILLGQKRARLSTPIVIVGLLAAAYLALISASKAALVSEALIIVVSMFGRLRTVLIAIVTGLVLFLAVPQVGDAVDRTIKRIETDDSFGFVEERGYDRIINNPEYWVFGAGEGGYMRFAETTMIRSHELHSSGGTVFFCYGIAGTFVFILFMFQVIRVAHLRQVLIILPTAAYGLSHQGLRVTLFWVFLALMVILGGRTAWRPAVGVKVKPPAPAPEGSELPAPAA